MQITSNLILFALGVSSVAAGPTNRHQKFHERKRALGDPVTAVIDGQTVTWKNDWDPATATPAPSGVSPPAPANPTPAAAAPVAAAEGASPVAAAGQAVNSALSSFKNFCPPSKRATTSEIAYAGNTGSQWGCNMMLVDNSIADQYDNTLTFQNQHDSDQVCCCWNKISPEGTISGWFGNAAVKFDLPVGTSQVVAVDTGSLGGCSCGAGGVPKDGIGQWAGTWLEMSIGDGQTGGWSGLDVSAIVPQTSGMEVQGMQVCVGEQCSALTANAAQNDNAYVRGMEAADGVGINLAPGNVKANIIVGY